VSLEACLPDDLRGPATTITRVSAGLSGAGVYRVDAAGAAFVLKVSVDDPIEVWRGRAQIQQLAASAGLAPRVVHVDEARRAVLSAFVVDRGFPALLFQPATRDAAIAQLGRTLRRVHDLPVPGDADELRPLALLTRIWPGLDGQIALPGFVGDAVRRMLAEPIPPYAGALVLGHNDVNPTNLIYDGEHLLLLDWDTAGPSEPYYDLAATAVFFRMDDPTCLRLIAAHDADAVTELPARFVYDRRLVAVLCGTLFLHLAHHGGHAGASGDETLDATPSLADVYQRMRAGELNPGTSAGQWALGLALLKLGGSL